MAEDIDVASHYGIQTAFPETWPAELDESDVSESEQYSAGANAKRRSTRYSALGRASTLAGGSNRTGDNVAKKDEADPLGSSDSVMYILKKRGIPVDDDMRLRNRFLLSSTSFSPALFLSQAHQDASAEDLIEGLQFLSRSIDQKSASLKELVEANFERFVRAKATIDSVYTEMRYHGAAKSRPPSHRASGQYRYSLVGNAPPAQASQSANKTALVKESEYGVKGIRAPLVEASVKAEELWGPALSGREREQDLYAVVNNVERNRAVFEIGGNISKAIKQQDFDRIFEEYRRAKTLTNEARSITDRAATENRGLTEAESHTVIGTGRMWTDVEHQVDAFKRDLWRRLSNVHTPSSSHLTAAGPVEEHMELIGALLELGVEDNPVWVWLISSYRLLKTKLTAFCERSIVEIEVLRRRLAANEKPSPQVKTALFRASLREGADPKDKIDTDQTIELWECIQAFLTKLLSVQTGLLGEVIEFWETAQSFINGSKQKMLPAGFEGESRKHHKLPSDGVRELQEGVVELVDLIRQNVLSLFTEPPIEDISLLFSPVPQTPGITPTESRFKIDPKNIPPPSPSRGEVGEEYAFWPPYSNSLSGVHYLSKFLVLIGTAASEMAALSPITAGSSSYDHLKSLVSVTRERSVRVACATWNKDAENCKMLEDWTRDPERRELTTMPGLFVAFESTVLAGMQKILYISEAMSKAGSVDVVTPPPAKILQMVRTQFVTSVYKALSGLVENAERPVMSNDGDSWILSEASRPAKSMDSVPVMATSESIDAKNRNIRMLLTLSNLKAFQTDFVPQLVSNFETAFSVKLTDEAKTIRDVLGQIDDRLFQSYTTPTIAALDATIKNGIKSAEWVPTTNRPDQVRPYVYSTMLTLVLVHTEITTTIPISSSTAPSSSSSSSTNNPSLAHPLLTGVLNHLVTKISSSLLEAFQSRPKYTLPALMQATLDTEFIAQTMSQYVTEEASSIQSQIYLELDRRTNNEARAKLQAELGEMRVILKKLRERTKGEFACFRKMRPPLGSKGSST